MYLFDFSPADSFTLDLQYDEDVGRATGTGEAHEDFLSNLSRISQLTGDCLSLSLAYVPHIRKQVSRTLYMLRRT